MKGQIDFMDYNKLNELKKRYGNYEEVFKSGDYDKAADILGNVLDVIEEEYKGVRKAGMIDKELVIRKSEGDGQIWLCTNHIMEYYIYACYFEPEMDVKMTELPIAEYYRTYAELCVKLQKYKRAEDAYKNALCWNPVDLDSYLGLAECYKYLNMITRYLDMTKQAYRFCCTRATMARFYRNMGFYYLSSYNTDMAEACYTYSNIYYHTDNADSELEYIKNALAAVKNNESKDSINKDEDVITKEEVNENEQKYTIKQMQEMFDKEHVEPGPDSKTIGIIYRVGELMLQDKEYRLAKDCFMIVYDITNEQQLEGLIAELDSCLKEETQ
jgi:tetratricopeptide (TPR) repeat protein